MEAWSQGAYDADTSHEYVRIASMNRGRVLLCGEIINMFENLEPPPKKEGMPSRYPHFEE